MWRPKQTLGDLLSNADAHALPDRITVTLPDGKPETLW